MTTADKIIKNKLGLLNLAKQLSNVTQACQVQAFVKMVIDLPAYGQLRTSNELKRNGIMISTGGVRSIWQRNDLETFKKRLNILSLSS